MKWIFEATARAPSELRFSEFFSLNYRLLADFLSDLGKRVKLVKFEAKHEYLCFGRLENIKIPHIHLKFTICVSLNGYQFKIKASNTRNWSQWDWDFTQKKKQFDSDYDIDSAQLVSLWLRQNRVDSNFTQTISLGPVATIYGIRIMEPNYFWCHAMAWMYSIRWTSSSTCSTRSTSTTNWTSCWRTFKRTTLMSKKSNKDLPTGRDGWTIVGWIPDMFSLNSNRSVLWFGRQYHLSTHLRSPANHNPHLHHRGFNHLRSVRLTVLLFSRNC